MRSVLLLTSQTEGQLYSMERTKLRYVRSYDLANDRPDTIQNIEGVIIGASLLAWRCSGDVNQNAPTSNFIFAGFTSHNPSDLIITKWSRSSADQQVLQAWIKRSHLDELRARWNLKSDIATYAEPLCFQAKGVTASWQTGHIMLQLKPKEGASELISRDNPAVQSSLPDMLHFTGKAARFIDGANKAAKTVRPISGFRLMLVSFIMIVFLGLSAYGLTLQRQNDQISSAILAVQTAIEPPAMEWLAILAPYVQNGSLKTVRIEQAGRVLKVMVSLPLTQDAGMIKALFKEAEFTITPQDDMFKIEVRQ